nr:hypothetical protein [Methylobacterium durans]
MIAAGVASDWSVEEIHRHILEAFVESSPLDDYTPPVVSLTRGAKVDARLKSRFGEAVIEDLWLPFFCISTNLSSGTSKIHDRGHVAGALRASIAIPGLLPPVLSEEGVLVDGAP